MTLLGNFVQTSGQDKEKGIKEREKIVRECFMKI